MKINAQLFLDHVDKASVGGLIDQVVFGDHLSFAVFDETKSVVAICERGIIESPSPEIGIFKLDLFSKAIQYARDIIFPGEKFIDIQVIDNRLVFKNGDDEFKFLLSSPDTVATTVANPVDFLKKVRATTPRSIILSQEVRSKITKAIQVISPDNCEIRVELDKVKIFVGKELEHNAVVLLGAEKGKGSFKVAVRSTFLSKVLSVLPKDLDATLEIRNDMPLAITVDSYVFLMASPD